MQCTVQNSPVVLQTVVQHVLSMRDKILHCAQLQLGVSTGETIGWQMSIPCACERLMYLKSSSDYNYCVIMCIRTGIYWWIVVFAIFMPLWAISQRRHIAVSLSGHTYVYMRESVFYLLSEWQYFNEGHHTYSVNVMRSTWQMTFSRSWVQSSRSCSHGHRNLVNSVAPLTLKGFEPKLNTNICHTQTMTWLGKWVRGSLQRSRSQSDIGGVV